MFFLQQKNKFTNNFFFLKNSFILRHYMKKIITPISKKSKANEIDIIKFTHLKEIDFSSKKYNFSKNISEIICSENNKQLSLKKVNLLFLKNQKNLNKDLKKHQDIIEFILKEYPFFNENKEIFFNTISHYFDPHQSIKFPSIKYDQEAFFSAHGHPICLKLCYLFNLNSIGIDGFYKPELVLFGEVFSSIKK